MPFLAPGILIPGGLFARETDDQNVIPSVFVEVISIGEEIVRVFILRSQGALEAFDFFFCAIRFLASKRYCGTVEFVALLEIRPLIPIGAGDDIHCSIVIKITEGRAL